MAKAKENKEMVPYRRGWIPSVFEEMDRMFEDFMPRPIGRRFWPSLRWPEEMAMPHPSVDVFESDSEVTVKAELPGIKKDDLSVDITEDSVTISGEKKKEEKVEEKNYFTLERSSGSFRRTVAFPAEVQSAKAKASFKNGVLEIIIPKKTEARKVKVTIE